MSQDKLLIIFKEEVLEKIPGGALEEPPDYLLNISMSINERPNPGRNPGLALREILEVTTTEIWRRFLDAMQKQSQEEASGKISGKNSEEYPKETTERI